MNQEVIGVLALHVCYFSIFHMISALQCAAFEEHICVARDRLYTALATMHVEAIEGADTSC